MSQDSPVPILKESKKSLSHCHSLWGKNLDSSSRTTTPGLRQLYFNCRRTHDIIDIVKKIIEVALAPQQPFFERNEKNTSHHHSLYVFTISFKMGGEVVKDHDDISRRHLSKL
ncbi:hypothetical protein AVEN_232387-1 [Araneus ventricosus]|uniref:Uncharacterized protein n=1 Tax=Araneus ventricosus TaxID=182803 RepID=A0A4Y2CW50_ARAVE|nr:hypothetical protein AVEN_232387-1 [Araneus ventricosus]